MDLIIRGLTVGLVMWFALLAAIVIWRVLNRDIETAGLLSATRRGSDVAPERALNMAVLPIVILSYAITALHTNVSATHSLPDISNELLMLFTGSNGLYLAGKISRAQ